MTKKNEPIQEQYRKIANRMKCDVIGVPIAGKDVLVVTDRGQLLMYIGAEAIPPAPFYLYKEGRSWSEASGDEATLMLRVDDIGHDLLSSTFIGWIEDTLTSYALYEHTSISLALVRDGLKRAKKSRMRDILIHSKGLFSVDPDGDTYSFDVALDTVSTPISFPGVSFLEFALRFEEARISDTGALLFKNDSEFAAIMPFNTRTTKDLARCAGIEL